MNTTTDSIHAACTAQTTIATPLGPVLLARTTLGLAGAWFEGQKHHPGPLPAPQQPDDALLRRTADQLHAYFKGARDTFELPLDLHGTAFQLSVWQALQRIVPGTTCTYGVLSGSQVQLPCVSSLRPPARRSKHQGRWKSPGGP